MHTKTSLLLRDCFFAAVAYIATTWACMWLLNGPLSNASLVLRGLVSVIPLLAIGLSTRAAVRLVLAGDEMQRRIDLEAIAIASLTVGFSALTLSLLSAADVVALSGQRALAFIFPGLCCAYVAARVWIRRRYA